MHAHSKSKPHDGSGSSSESLCSSVRKHSSKVLPNFNYQMFEQGQSPTDLKPGVRKGLSQTATTLTSKSVGDATSACLATMDSERITNPKAYETMFAVPASSKFGGLKKRS